MEHRRKSKRTVCDNNERIFVPELDFVMTLDGKLIGQNVFMNAVIVSDDGRNVWCPVHGGKYKKCTEEVFGADILIKNVVSGF